MSQFHTNTRNHYSNANSLHNLASYHNKSPLVQGRLEGSFEELFAAGCIQTGGEDRDDNNKINAEEALNIHGGIFFALMAVTGRNPCNGCPAMTFDQKDRPTCKAYKMYHSANTQRGSFSPDQRRSNQEQAALATSASGKNGKKYEGKTIRQIAELEGVSLGEARRRKQQGEYD